MMVKVCGITRREDALVAVNAGASAIGFIFYPKSPRYITPERAAEIGEGLNVWKVGIFVQEDPATIEILMKTAHLDVAQIYGGEALLNRRVWRAIRMPLPAGAPVNDINCEALLIDGLANGQTFDWSGAKGLSGPLANAHGSEELLSRDRKGAVIVAGGLDASNVAEAIRIARPWGVDASSKLETAPGIKDHEKVKAFVAAALAAGKEYAC